MKRLDQIFAEDVALEQELVILRQTIQRLFERRWHGRHALHLFR
jgi:hypothetical protein